MPNINHLLHQNILKLYLVCLLTLAFSFVLLLQSKIATHPIATSKQMINAVVTAITIRKARFEEGTSNMGISESPVGISPNLKCTTHTMQLHIT